MFNVKRLIHKAIPEVAVPAGTLQPSDLQPRLAVHSGIPAQAQVLAYEPVQRLLAVGSSDGRVKIFGGDGIEGLFQSLTKAPTLILQFLYNKGRLVHVTTTNQIEVWDLEERKLVASCTWDTEVAAIAQVPGSNYIYIGDDTGVVRVLELRKELLQPLPYCIPPHVTLAGLISSDSEDPPSVVALLPQPDAEFGRLLIAYSNGLLVLWALHEGRVLALRGGTDQQKARLLSFEGRPSQDGTEDEDDDAGEQLRCVAWADAGGALLAAGYDNGDIKFWSFPAGKAGTVSESDGFKIETEPSRLVRLARGSSRAPVTALRWTGASSRDRGRLYVLGGGAGGTPDLVRVVSLTPPSDDADLLYRELPWFGPVSDALLTPPPGGLFGSPASTAIILSSPGQIHLYDEPSVAEALSPGESEDAHPPLPQPLSLFEQLTPISVTETVTGTAAAVGLSTLLQMPREDRETQLPSGGKWPVEGGSVGSPPPQDDELFTVVVAGYECGRVVFWDASTPVLKKVCVILGGDKESEKVPPVTALSFCPISGLLVVAHQGGKVRIHILGTEDRELTQHNIDADGKIGKDRIHASRGFQLVSTLLMHEATIRSIAIASSQGKLAMGDDDGNVSIFDLATGTFTNLDRAFDFKSPIASLAFSTFPSSPDPGANSSKGLPSSPPKRTASIGSSSSGADDVSDDVSVLLYVAAATAAVTVLDANTGSPAGAGPVQTKNASKAVEMILLDSRGRPLPRLLGPLSLPWAFDGPIAPKPPPAQPPKLAPQKSGGSAMDRLKAFYSDEGPASPKDGGKSSPRARDGSPKRGLRREFGEFEALFVLLVAEDCLRLYTAAAIHAGDRTTLKKEKVEGGDCAWAGAVGLDEEKMGPAVVMLTKQGEVHIRSLPDLALLQGGPLAGAVGWPLDAPVRRLKAASVAPDGRLFLPDAVSEALLLSLYKKENALGLPASLPHLHDHVLAAAADAAAVASRGVAPPPPAQETKAAAVPEDKKKKNIFHAIKAAGDNIRVAAEKGLTEVKNLAEGVVTGGGGGAPTSFLQGKHSGTVLASHGADELPSLFSSRPFVPAARRLAPTAEVLPSESSKSLDIDDIDLDSPSTSASTSLRSKVTARVSSGFASIRRKSAESKQDAEPAAREKDDRARLFDNAAESGPKQRSAAEIRAAYGKAGSAQASAAQARDKLLERQEKLQGLDRKTAEMQDGASNFASMAAELEKKMAGKKWWQM